MFGMRVSFVSVDVGVAVFASLFYSALFAVEVVVVASSGVALSVAGVSLHSRASGSDKG